MDEMVKKYPVDGPFSPPRLTPGGALALASARLVAELMVFHYRESGRLEQYMIALS